MSRQNYNVTASTWTENKHVFHNTLSDLQLTYSCYIYSLVSTVISYNSGIKGLEHSARAHDVSNVTVVA